MKIIMLLLIAIASEVPVAWSKELKLMDWQMASVKTSSFPCLTTRPRFSGSGLLISFAGELWVLTSEHVVLQDKSSATCHEIQNDWGVATAKLIAADYAKGLALLQVTGPGTSPTAGSGSLFRFAIPAELLSRGVLPSSSMAALGYPALSDSLQTLKDGNLIKDQSRRALIPGLNGMLEIAHLPVEFGMSGGPLLASGPENSFAFAGILSHQVLRREAGVATRAVNLIAGEPGNYNDFALGISAHDAFAWFVAQVQEPSGLVWQRLASAQRSGDETIQFGPLLFSLKQEKAQEAWKVGGADGSGVGGADGAGIQIGDGTGGDPAAKAPQIGEETLNTIEVKLDPKANPETLAAPLMDTHLNQWRLWLLSGKKVKIVYLRNRQAIRLTRLDSLAQFMTAWLRDGSQPVAIRSQSGTEKSDLEQRDKLARTATQMTQGLYDKPNTSSDRKSWLATLRDLTLMAETGMTTSQDLTLSLSGPNSPNWEQFYEDDFVSAVALESAIQNLVQQMKKMGL